MRQMLDSATIQEKEQFFAWQRKFLRKILRKQQTYKLKAEFEKERK